MKTEPNKINKSNWETAMHGVNWQDETKRVYNAGYPIRKSYSTEYSRVEVIYHTGNSQSKDMKHELICWSL